MRSGLGVPRKSSVFHGDAVILSRLRRSAVYILSSPTIGFLISGNATINLSATAQTVAWQQRLSQPLLGRLTGCAAGWHLVMVSV